MIEGIPSIMFFYVKFHLFRDGVLPDVPRLLMVLCAESPLHAAHLGAIGHESSLDPRKDPGLKGPCRLQARPAAIPILSMPRLHLHGGGGQVEVVGSVVAYRPRRPRHPAPPGFSCNSPSSQSCRSCPALCSCSSRREAKAWDA